MPFDQTFTCDEIRRSGEGASCSWILALQPDAAAACALGDTFDAYARACEHACGVGRGAGTAGNARLHDLCYQELRERFALPANLAVRAIARAAALLKLAHREPAVAADRIDYDPRVLSISPAERSVSLATVAGRRRGIPAEACGGRWPAGGSFSRASLLRRGEVLVLLVWGHPAAAATPEARRR